MLTELRRRLRAGEGTLVVQALYGLGGVGKTQLAIEYAHRFSADYDLVWCCRHGQASLNGESSSLVSALDCFGLSPITHPLSERRVDTGRL